jgi:DNA-binding NtrC family response regulator
MQHVPVRPLAYRSGEVEKLLDRQFGERSFSLRVAEMKPANHGALKAYHWPNNFDELREVADAIMAHATLGGLRPAAQSLGISHQTLQRRFVRVGLELPLFGRDA